MIIRKLELNDYYLGYLELLFTLTTVGDISFGDWSNRFCEITNNPLLEHLVVLDASRDSNIIAIGTLIIEPKFIHNLGKVGHIEDIVVSSNHQGVGLGKIIINKLVEQAKIHGCYKVILNCNKNNVGFYEKCGFSQKDIQMANYA